MFKTTGEKKSFNKMHGRIERPDDYPIGKWAASRVQKSRKFAVMFCFAYSFFYFLFLARHYAVFLLTKIGVVAR